VDRGGFALGKAEDLDSVQDAIEPVARVSQCLGHWDSREAAEEVHIKEALKELVTPIPNLSPAMVVARIILVEIPAFSPFVERLSRDLICFGIVMKRRNHVQAVPGDDLLIKLLVRPSGKEKGRADGA
jgi:hypothetical protein